VVIAPIKQFDTSGKSPADIHHRIKFRAGSFREASPGMHDTSQSKRAVGRWTPVTPSAPLRDWSNAFGERSGDGFKKGFDTSGKSLADIHHRKNSKSPRRKIGRGLFQWNFRIGRRPARNGATSFRTLPERRKRAVVRPFWY
jgi:hypothetical protein